MADRSAAYGNGRKRTYDAGRKLIPFLKDETVKVDHTAMEAMPEAGRS
jgi:hypothetical protein